MLLLGGDFRLAGWWHLNRESWGNGSRDLSHPPGSPVLLPHCDGGRGALFCSGHHPRSLCSLGAAAGADLNGVGTSKEATGQKGEAAGWDTAPAVHRGGRAF